MSLSGLTYSITTCCAERQALLGGGAIRDLVAAALLGMLTRGWDRLDGYVVMPDHLHFIFELGPGQDLAAVMRGFKTYTALRSNRLLGRRGAFWQDGYYEHAIRSESEWRGRMEYMLANPVRAGLAERVEEYPWARYGPWTRNG